MRILLSNDDGIHAIGIQTLAKALRALPNTEVVIVAPDRNRSAASSCLTLSEPLRVRQHGENDYAVINGTPADCVHLALNGLFDEPFDCVIGGINAGANLGDDVIYSGTVACALEGRHRPFPATAISLVGEQHFESAARVLVDLLPKLSANCLPEGNVLNINVPDLPFEQIKGTQIVRLGTRHPAAQLVEIEDPRGEKLHWIGANGKPLDCLDGTDFYAIEQGYVSIVPLSIDMTARSTMPVVEALLNK